jgi:hypothetical protein
MSGWDILNELMKNVPPVAALLFFLALGVIFAVGFSKHGVNFIKYGFKQTILGDSLDKRFDAIDRRFETFDRRFDAIDTRFEAIDKRFDKVEARIDGIQVEFKTELETIKSNHFGHLKNFLTELTSILLDKGVINNENKARLDNQLRGM